MPSGVASMSRVRGEIILRRDLTSYKIPTGPGKGTSAEVNTTFRIVRIDQAAPTEFAVPAATISQPHPGLQRRPGSVAKAALHQWLRP